MARVQEAALGPDGPPRSPCLAPAATAAWTCSVRCRARRVAAGPTPRACRTAERVTRQVLLGLDRFGGDDAFWWQATTAMLHAGFTLFVASGKPPSFAGR